MSICHIFGIVVAFGYSFNDIKIGYKFSWQKRKEKLARKAQIN